MTATDRRSDDDGPISSLANELNAEPPLTVLARQIREVFAAESVRCPGGHRTDSGYGDHEDLWVDVMTEHDILDAIATSSILAAENLPRYNALSKVVQSRWVVAGACNLTIPVHEEWDGDGEWKPWCYPVADGPCAETMQLNEDYEGAFWAAYFAQERLRKAVEVILCAALDTDATAHAGGEGEW